ncbi:MAG: ATP-binding cassette domain-containing protein [Bacteroidales bacterium]|nr:ATP-binding cassette domain-containing protein [Bacteroidales bacterium]
MITVSHLFKDFVTPEGDWTYAVKDVSFHVSRGEVVGIIGSSGSGKSVLLRCMAGLEQPTSGEVTLSPGVKVGMVFQQFNLFGHLSVLDNETLAPMKLLGLGREEAEELAMEMLRHVGLDSIIFLYTDGLTEAENTTHGQFGEERMLAELEEMAHATPRELIDHISEAVQVFESDTEQSDDLTMLAIRYTQASK